VSGQNGIALGNSAKANFTNSIAIGYDVITNSANTIRIGNSSIMKAQLGNLSITWSSTSVRFSYGVNSVTLTLSPP
jgi:hypothetical protein